VSDLTPTEELVMEVLAARYRNGESYWTFSYRHRATLNRLAGKGLVDVEQAPTPNLEARLTEAGRRDWLWSGWTPPFKRIVKEIAEDLTDGAGISWWMAQAREHGLDADALLRVATAAGRTLVEHGRLIRDVDRILWDREATS
jgi:hypothetical protein